MSPVKWAKSVRSLGKHADQGFFLPRIDPATKAIKQLRLGEKQVNPVDRAPLRLDRDIGKPVEPFIDPVRLARALKLGVSFQ